MQKEKIERAKHEASFRHVFQSLDLKDRGYNIQDVARKAYEAGVDFVIDNPEKFGLVRSTDPADLEKRKAIRETLDGLLRNILAAYQAEVDQVNWHNNNMPGVGQNIDYKSLPPYPVEAARLEELKAAI
jgi:hypothetical protein